MQFERQALFWTAIALLLAYLVQLLAPVLLPFVLGLTLAYFFNPIVDLLGRIGLPRWASALLLLAISTCLIVIALIFVVPILVQQAAGLIEAATPRNWAPEGLYRGECPRTLRRSVSTSRGDHQDGIGCVQWGHTVLVG